MRKLNLTLSTGLVLLAAGAQGQECASAQVVTHEAYQYGRFETRMQSAQGGGIISAFFLYNLDLGCNWPAENNEIDIEMTGNLSDSVQFTTHYPGPWGATQIVPVGFNPHAAMHDYAFEWEPGIVRWFVDGQLAYVQDEPFVDGLIYPMRILMNHWAVDNPAWAGVWDPSAMPTQSRYDYVRYYAYTPGAGHAGTGDNFTFQWADEFDDFDTSRWEATEFGGFGGNLCTFVSANAGVSGGELQLSMTEPLATTFSQVSFSVDVTVLNLQPADVVYLNGTFNNWCGTCQPMSDADGDDIWERTLTLPAGNHEYLFTVNGWSQIGGAPAGSSCDFLPCDQYNNYGIAVPYDSGPIDTQTYCWSSCDSCGLVDPDNDGIDASIDNCLTAANTPQTDTDGDGFGNRCDADLNNDCLVNFADLDIFRDVFFGADPDADLNGDQVVNFADLLIVKAGFFAPPGPSALASCP